MVSIVEDDPRICQLIEEEVIDEGHSTRCFRTAEEFLKVTGEIHFDLVLLDLMLPGMDGLDLLGSDEPAAGVKIMQGRYCHRLKRPRKAQKSLKHGRNGLHH